MARETEAQLAERISGYNNQAARVPTGVSYRDTYFGQVTLGKLQSQDEDGYDIYKVHHTGFDHYWSSASVAAAFKDYL